MLAAISDLEALGSVGVGVPATDPQYTRAMRLLELAQGLALSYLRTDETTVTADWSAYAKTRLTVWIAEKAATRLNVPAAPNVDPYGNPPANRSMMLNRWEKEDLLSIAADAGVPSRSGLGTLTIVREDDLVEPISRWEWE